MSVVTPYDVDDDRDYREGSRWPWILLGGLVAVLLVVGLSFLWLQHQINPGGKPGAEVAVRVEKGMSLDDIGKLLEQKGVITSANIFKYYAKLNGSPSVEAGDFTFHKNSSMGAALKILKGGAASTEKPIVLTVPEGLELKEVAEKVGQIPGLSADKFLEVAKSGTVRSQFEPANSNNLEGLLMPETYFLSKTDNEEAVLRKMVDTFDKNMRDLDLVNQAAKIKLTPYQVIVASSIVEREALLAEDRNMIARVILNRLDQGMRLQMDSTIQYSLGYRKTPILYADLEVASPYNTYKNDGLPPGPIADVGKATVDAMLHPATGTWLYFVIAEANGKQAFATTNADFNRLVAEAEKKGLL